MGRIRKEKYGPRIIDIDMLLLQRERNKLPVIETPPP